MAVKLVPAGSVSFQTSNVFESVADTVIFLSVTLDVPDVLLRPEAVTIVFLSVIAPVPISGAVAEPLTVILRSVTLDVPDVLANPEPATDIFLRVVAPVPVSADEVTVPEAETLIFFEVT